MISPSYQIQEDKQFIPRTHPRISHLRKLYSLMAFQWTFSIIISILTMKFEEFSEILRENSFILYVSLITTIFLLFFTFFFRSVASQTPLNLLVYFLFTVSIAFCFAYGVIYDETLCFFMVILGGFLINISLLLYVLTTKCEITYQGATLFILAAIFIGLEGFLLYSSMKLVMVLIISFFEVIWGFYVVYDTQTMVSGVKYDWNKDDYVSGAVGVYVDVGVLLLRLSELVKNLIVKERN